MNRYKSISKFVCNKNYKYAMKSCKLIIETLILTHFMRIYKNKRMKTFNKFNI